MRVTLSHRLSLAAAILSAGCNTPTGPGPVESPSDIQVLTVAPSFARIDGGGFIKLTATVNADGRPTTPPDVDWYSADTNVATVRTDGIVEARKAGRVQIVAVWQKARGSAVVLVLDQVTKKPLTPKKPSGPTCLKRIPMPEKHLIPDDKC